MSFDTYQFHMVLRQQQMTHAERLAADEQAARLWRVLRRAFAAGAALWPRRIP